jgi:hypothetical protein
MVCALKKKDNNGSNFKVGRTRPSLLINCDNCHRMDTLLLLILWQIIHQHKIIATMKKLLLVLMIMAFFASCGGGEATDQATEQVQQTIQEAVSEVTIEGNDMIQYNLKTIEVTEG